MPGNTNVLLGKSIHLTNQYWTDVYMNEDHEVSVNGCTLSAHIITEYYYYPAESEPSGIVAIPEERKVFTLHPPKGPDKTLIDLDDWLVFIEPGVCEIYTDLLYKQLSTMTK